MTLELFDVLENSPTKPRVFIWMYAKFNPIQAVLLRALESRGGGDGGIWSPHCIFGLGNAIDLKIGMDVVFDK